ncbi:ANS1B protein, partial [Atractosteus spatula]|nr:ANS1B protein [Atractosteus spatula]
MAVAEQSFHSTDSLLQQLQLKWRTSEEQAPPPSFNSPKNLQVTGESPRPPPTRESDRQPPVPRLSGNLTPAQATQQLPSKRFEQGVSLLSSMEPSRQEPHGQLVQEEQFLIWRGLNVNCTDSSGYTPLHHASLNGHRDVVLKLLQYEASANIADNKGCFPLHLAAWKGDVEIVKILIHYGPSHSRVNEQVALRNPSRREVLQGDGLLPINLLNCPFCLCSAYQTLSFALSPSGTEAPHLSGYSAFLIEHSFLSPCLLHAPASLCDIAQGPTVSATPPLLRVWKLTGLLWLAVMAHVLLQAFEALKNNENETALHCAAQYGHSEVVAVLLEELTDPTMRNSRSETPLDLAALYGRLPVVKMLVNAHPNLMSCSTRKHTPLHLAARNGHKAVVQVLLEAGMDVNCQTEKGSALHEAALFGKVDVVRLLLETGIDANIKDSQERMALDILKEHPSQKSQQITALIQENMSEKQEQVSVEEPVRPVPTPRTSVSSPAASPSHKTKNETVTGELSKLLNEIKMCKDKEYSFEDLCQTVASHSVESSSSARPSEEDRNGKHMLAELRVSPLKQTDRPSPPLAPAAEEEEEGEKSCGPAGLWEALTPCNGCRNLGFPGLSQDNQAVEIVPSPSLDVFSPEEEDNPFEFVATAVTRKPCSLDICRLSSSKTDNTPHIAIAEPELRNHGNSSTGPTPDCSPPSPDTALKNIEKVIRPQPKQRTSLVSSLEVQRPNHSYDYSEVSSSLGYASFSTSPPISPANYSIGSVEDCDLTEKNRSEGEDILCPREAPAEVDIPDGHIPEQFAGLLHGSSPACESPDNPFQLYSTVRKLSEPEPVSISSSDSSALLLCSGSSAKAPKPQVVYRTVFHTKVNQATPGPCLGSRSVRNGYQRVSGAAGGFEERACTLGRMRSIPKNVLDLQLCRNISKSDSNLISCSPIEEEYRASRVEPVASKPIPVNHLERTPSFTAEWEEDTAAEPQPLLLSSQPPPKGTHLLPLQHGRFTVHHELHPDCSRAPSSGVPIRASRSPCCETERVFISRACPLCCCCPPPGQAPGRSEPQRAAAQPCILPVVPKQDTGDPRGIDKIMSSIGAGINTGLEGIKEDIPAECLGCCGDVVLIDDGLIGSAISVRFSLLLKQQINPSAPRCQTLLSCLPVCLSRELRQFFTTLKTPKAILLTLPPHATLTPPQAPQTHTDTPLHKPAPSSLGVRRGPRCPVQSVGQWLDSIGLVQYENHLLANGFDNVQFMGSNVVEDQDLLEIGILNSAHRQRLLQAIRLLPRVRPIGYDGNNPTSVAEWLESLELGDYTKAFLINGYTSMDLVKKIWEIELINVLKISLLGHRKRILASLGDRLHDDPPQKPPRSITLREPSGNHTPPQLSPSLSQSTYTTAGSLDVPHIIMQADARRRRNENYFDDVPRSKLERQMAQVSMQGEWCEPITLRPPNEATSSTPVQYWQHHPEKLIFQSCDYEAYYLGSMLVKELRGTESTQDACAKMRKSTEHMKKVPTIVLSVSYKGVKFIDASNKASPTHGSSRANIIAEHEIRNISCAAQDPEDLSTFAYITKDLKSSHHYCHVFTAFDVNLAYEIILTLGQAFEVAYQLALQARKSGHGSSTLPESFENKPTKPIPKPRVNIRKSVVMPLSGRWSLGHIYTPHRPPHPPVPPSRLHPHKVHFQVSSLLLSAATSVVLHCIEQPSMEQKGHANVPWIVEPGQEAKRGINTKYETTIF